MRRSEANPNSLAQEISSLRAQQGISLTKIRRCTELLAVLTPKFGARATDDEVVRRTEDILTYAVGQIADERRRLCASTALNLAHETHNLTERRGMLTNSLLVSARQIENIENDAFLELASIVLGMSHAEVVAALNVSRQMSGPSGSRTIDASFRNLAIDSVVTVFEDGRQHFIDLIDIEFLRDDVEFVEALLRPSAVDNGQPGITTEALRGFSVEETINNGDVFVQTWRFPRAFKAGERHSIAQAVTTAHAVKPYYAYAPAAKPIDHLRLQLTFKDWSPTTVSLLDGIEVHKLGASDLSLFGEPLPIDAMGGCQAEFDRLSPGFVYGICWATPGVMA